MHDVDASVLELLGSECSATHYVSLSTLGQLRHLLVLSHRAGLRLIKDTPTIAARIEGNSLPYLCNPIYIHIMLALVSFPELTRALSSPHEPWVFIAVAVIQEAIARADAVHKAIALWSTGNNVHPNCGGQHTRRENDLLRYAGEALVSRVAHRTVPQFAGTRQSDAAYDNGDEQATVCQKNYEGKRAPKPRCMLFLHICLEHGAVCHYHLTRAEGRKDMILPIFRSWETLPKAIVYDYACG